MGTLGHCLLYIQRALATRLVGRRLSTEGTDNHTDRGTHGGAHTVGHTCWATLGQYQLYIQRAETTSQIGAQWGTVYCM